MQLCHPTTCSTRMQVTRHTCVPGPAMLQSVGRLTPHLLPDKDGGKEGGQEHGAPCLQRCTRPAGERSAPCQPPPLRQLAIDHERAHCEHVVLDPSKQGADLPARVPMVVQPCSRLEQVVQYAGAAAVAAGADMAWHAWPLGRLMARPVWASPEHQMRPRKK